MSHLLRFEYIELDFCGDFYMWALERSIADDIDHELQLLCMGWEL